MKSVTLGRFTYFNPLKCLAIAMVSTFLLLAYAEPRSIGFMLFKLNFYIAWALNALLAYFIISACIWLTRWLDYSYPWQRSFAKRWPMQLWLVVVLPILFTSLLLGLYFWSYEKNIFYTSYFRRYLFLDTLMLLLLNGVLFFSHQAQNRETKRQKHNIKQPVNLPALPIPEDRIAYLYAKDKACYIVGFDAEELFWDLSLIKTLPILSAQRFYMVRRSYIVNRKAVQSLVKKNGTLQLQLLPELALTMMVSRQEIHAFTTWWEEPIV